jgi:hypothetical protein
MATSVEAPMNRLVNGGLPETLAAASPKDIAGRSEQPVIPRVGQSRWA